VKHGLRNVLDGGTETEYFADICAGDTLSVSSKVSDLTIRESKTTGQMLIVTNETTYVNQDGTVVAKQRGQGLFY
jgi:acyl dehydratase